MKCPKCGNKLSEQDVFCPECGREVIKKKSKNGKKFSEIKRAHLSKKWIIIASITLAILLGLGIVIFVIPLPYNATEASTVREPYDAQEAYTVKEPREHCYPREASYGVKWGDWLYDLGSDYVGVEILVTNNEKQELTFGFHMAYYDTAYFAWCDNIDYSKANMYSEPIYVTIGPYQTESLRFYTLKKNPDTGYCPMWYETSIPDVEECKIMYPDVTKYRTVTKYRDVYKEREVTRYATLFKQWTGRVKWYFKEGEG